MGLWTRLLSADNERDAREVDSGRVMGKELGERAGSESRRPNGVRMARCTEREGDRQLVGADGLRGVPVIPAAEVISEAFIDDLAQLLQSVQDLPGRVSALTAQRNACAIARL